MEETLDFLMRKGSIHYGTIKGVSLQMNHSIIYYTANLISDSFANNARNHLLEVSSGIPIISVSQKPLDFGVNFHVGNLIPSFYNVYRQILVGAIYCKTKYVVCCEDDTIYSPEHFSYEPPEGTFSYNVSFWHLRRDVFYYTGHRVMSQCIASTELMIKTLETRFEKYPDEASPPRGFGEPGKWEGRLGLPEVKIGTFMTKAPPITFRHNNSLSGVRNISERYNKRSELSHWGNAIDLWRRMYD